MPIESLILLVDDDKISLLLTKSVIQKIYPNHIILDFHEPQRALAFLKTIDQGKSKITIFLDINMPIISGWQFLDLLHFDNIQCDVYILTSSLLESDKKISLNYKRVKDFITKPISVEKLKALEPIKK